MIMAYSLIEDHMTVRYICMLTSSTTTLGLTWDADGMILTEVARVTQLVTSWVPVTAFSPKFVQLVPTQDPCFKYGTHIA